MMRVIHLSAAQLAHRHTWIHNERHTALARLTSASAEYATALLVLLLAVASLLSPSSHSTRRTAAALAAANVAPVAGMCMVVCTLSQSQQSAHGKLCVEWTLLRVYSCLYYRALVRVLANKQVGYSTCAVRCNVWGFLMEGDVTHMYATANADENKAACADVLTRAELTHAGKTRSSPSVEHGLLITTLSSNPAFSWDSSFFRVPLAQQGLAWELA